nr:hypothetical protein [Pseudomonas sp. P818]
MSALPSKITFFRQGVAASAGVLSSAGIGLKGIGLMLAERELSSSEANALHHAVIALGFMVEAQGGTLFDSADELEGNE